MTAAEVVRAEQLGKRFGRMQALRDVTFTVSRGEIFGLIGGNGAGKTTLLKILVGSSHHSAGSARVLGLRPVEDAAELRRRIGYMPQTPSLYEDLSALDNIRFFGRAHAPTDLEERVTSAVAFIGLVERARDPVYQLSGGMKSRVSLACAMVHHPELLFLDEPTAGVDPELRSVFWNGFRALAAEGTTLLVSTHQMDEALLCDRVAILRHGSIVACDSPAALLRAGVTTVRVWKGGSLIESVEVAGYGEKLPALLRDYGLDPSITRIDVEQETLEKVVLRLITGNRP